MPIIKFRLWEDFCLEKADENDHEYRYLMSAGRKREAMIFLRCSNQYLRDAYHARRARLAKHSATRL